MYIFTRGIVFILCFLSATVYSLPFPSFESVQLQNIVIFGDSFSDNGNVYALTNETYPIPPYWNGRYSNGPNWVDQLGILEISNYAYGSATTDSNLVQGYAKERTVPVPGLLQQVEIYLNNTNVNETDFARTLFILWGGGNDFIFNQNLWPHEIAASLLKSAQALLDIGAKNILVFNQVPVQYFPFSKPFEAPELFVFLTDEGNIHITNFTESIQLDNPQASLNIFDIHSVVLNFVTENSTYFTNTVDNCWVNANATTVVELCPDPEKYLFVDTLHFTTLGHRLIADAIRSFLFDSYQINTTSSTTPFSSSYTSSTERDETTQASSTSINSTVNTNSTSSFSSLYTYSTKLDETTQTSSTSVNSTVNINSTSSLSSLYTYSTKLDETTQASSTSANSAVTLIPQLSFNGTLIVFFLLQLFHFFQ